MTSATKPGPAKMAPAKAKATPPAASAFDFGALKPKVTEAWSREGGRQATPIPENILNALKTSKAQDAAGLFSVPGDPFERDDKGNAVKDAGGRDKLTGVAAELVSLLRRAGEQLKVGVRIKVDTNEDNTVSHVAFHATERRMHNPDKPRKPTRRGDETDPEYGARMAAYERDIARWKREQAQADN